VTKHEALTSPQALAMTVDDYLLLDRSGVFDGYGKTELINGTIYVVNAQYSQHMKAKVHLLRRLADVCDALGGGLEAWSEGSVEMGLHGMPEPDVFVTNATPGDGPVDRHSVVLIIEVSDTTQVFDLGEKASLYAANGIAEYWVVDLKDRTIHQLWSPDMSGYTRRDMVNFGDALAAVSIDGLVIATDGLG
jgi:Uma2 family endonuclease